MSEFIFKVGDRVRGIQFEGVRVLGVNDREYRRIPDEPKLYYGLTEEQWQQAVTDGLLCRLHRGILGAPLISKLHAIEVTGEGITYIVFRDDKLLRYTHCHIHPSQPQFNTGKKPDWLDDDDWVVINPFGEPKVFKSKHLDFNHPFFKIKRWQKIGV